MITNTNAPVDPLTYYLTDALTTLGADAGAYLGNSLSQDDPSAELALYQGTQYGYAVSAGAAQQLRMGSVAPTVAAGQQISGSTLLIVALVIGVVILATHK